jgi:tRNA U38,U39,U40 pseudouridine synthase TruA
MKPWHEYTSTGIDNLAEEAIDKAIRHIQNEMGIPTGDAAGLFFSGVVYEKMKEQFKDYVRFEISFFRKTNGG